MRHRKAARPAVKRRSAAARRSKEAGAVSDGLTRSEPQAHGSQPFGSRRNPAAQPRRSLCPVRAAFLPRPPPTVRGPLYRTHADQGPRANVSRFGEGVRRTCRIVSQDGRVGRNRHPKTTRRSPSSSANSSRSGTRAWLGAARARGRTGGPPCLADAWTGPRDEHDPYGNPPDISESAGTPSCFERTTSIPSVGG
jgi:hypothetical protein